MQNSEAKHIVSTIVKADIFVWDEQFFFLSMSRRLLSISDMRRKHYSMATYTYVT